MKNDIQKLIDKLKNENIERSKKINSGELNDYSHTVYVHIYNQNLAIIKELENILLNNQNNLSLNSVKYHKGW